MANPHIHSLPFLEQEAEKTKEVDDFVQEPRQTCYEPGVQVLQNKALQGLVPVGGEEILVWE